MKRPNIYGLIKRQILSYLNYFVSIHKCSYGILTWIKSNPTPTYGRNYLNDKEYCFNFRKDICLYTSYKSRKTPWITLINVKEKNYTIIQLLNHYQL